MTDYQQYQLLTAAMQLAIAEGSTDSDNFQKLWAEREQIKNRNGGMPPKKS
jgi:hypothetical protein